MAHKRDFFFVLGNEAPKARSAAARDLFCTFNFDFVSITLN
jgi:hypothetical protein